MKAPFSITSKTVLSQKISLVLIKLERKTDLNTTSLLSCFHLHFHFSLPPPHQAVKSRMGVGQEMGLRSVHHSLALLLLPPQGEDSHSNPATSPSLTLVSLILTTLSLAAVALGQSFFPFIKCVVSEAQPCTGAGPPGAVWQCSLGHREASAIFSQMPPT